jgi:hypothetical protein
MPGRKPLPVVVKEIKGTLQKCRINVREPKPTTALCTPPDVHVGRRQGSVELRRGQLAAGPAVGARRRGAGALGELLRHVPARRSKINQAGVSGMLIKTPSGILRRSPLMDVIRDLALEMKGYEAEMGFTPAARSRISLPARSDEGVGSLVGDRG